MKEIELTGSWFEMGRQYGRACRSQIWLFSKAVQVMVALSERPGADFFSPQYRHVPGVLFRFGKNRRRYRAQGRMFIETIEQHHPEGLAMMRGIAEGAHVDFDDLLFLNTAIELTRGCTSYAAAGDATTSGHPVVGMNADETKGVERSEVVLRLYPETGYAYTICAMAGYLAFNFGMNEAGLTMVNHLLFLKPGSGTQAVHPMLLYSSILNRCRTVDDARELLESLPACGVGLTLTVADSERFLRMETNSVERDIEIVDNGVRWNAMEPQSALLAPLSAIGDLTEANTLFSRRRAKRLDELTERYYGQLDAEAVRTILADHGNPNDETHMHSMCLHPKHTQGKQTCASMVALPAERTSWFYGPNPCRNQHTEYRYRSPNAVS